MKIENVTPCQITSMLGLLNSCFYIKNESENRPKKLHVVERGKVFLKKCLKKMKIYFENLQKTV